VESGKTVTATGLALSGPNSNSYVLPSSTVTATADITALAVTISSGLVANHKVCDGTTAASLSSNNVVLAGVLVGDTANVKLSTNGYTATFGSAAVGNNKIVSVGGLTLTGTAAANYTLTQPSLTANITEGVVAKLAFTTQPSLASAGVPFGQQPVVQTQDQYGNNSTVGLPANLVVTLSLSSGTGPLQGTSTLDIGGAAGNGAVHCTDLRIDPSGAKQLSANASGMTGASSTTFDIANVAPVANTATFTRPRNVPLKLLISNLLTNAIDTNGDSLTLVAVSSASTNGANLYTNATYVLYSPPPGGNVTDSFAYTVSDGTASSSGTVLINMQPDPTGTNSNVAAYGLVNGKPTFTFAGIPGYTYEVQRTQDLSGIPAWTDLLITNAPPAGLFQCADQNPPVGSVFYRAINR